MSGLRANVHKSQMFVAGVHGLDRQWIFEVTGIPEGTLPVRYLGIPLAAEGLRVLHYAPLLEKIAEQIGLWTASSLSYAGRLELIRSVLQGIHCFWLSILPLPVGVMEAVIRLCRTFLWDRGKPLVAWRDLTLPREEGGLGLRDTRAWNSALLSKVLWDIHLKKDTLWVRWMHHTYLRHTSIWELPARRDYSALLKKVLSIRDVIVHRQGSVEQAIACVQSWQKGSRVVRVSELSSRNEMRAIPLYLLLNSLTCLSYPYHCSSPRSMLIFYAGMRGDLPVI